MPLTGAPEALAAQLPPLGQFGPVLAEAEQKLNTDRRMGDAVAKAGNVALPMLFRLGEPRGRPDRPLPDFIRKNGITQVEKGEDAPLLTSDVEAPVVEELGRSAAAIGHLNVNPDVDGGIRTEPLVLAHFNEIYPALSLMIAAKSLNLGVADIKVKLGALGASRQPEDRHRSGHADEHLLLQGPRRQACVPGGFLLLPCVQRQDPTGQVQGQDRADRPDGRRHRQHFRHAGVARRCPRY